MLNAELAKIKGEQDSSEQPAVVGGRNARRTIEDSRVVINHQAVIETFTRYRGLF
jgi:hypothetical protein